MIMKNKRIINFIAILKAELLKYKRSHALILTIVAPIFLASMFFLGYYLKGSEFLQEGMNGWRHLIRNSFVVGSSFLFPMYIILLSLLIHQIEHRINGYKLCFTWPVKRWKVIAAKIMALELLIAFSLLVFGLALFLGGTIIEWHLPHLFEFDTELVGLTATILLGIFTSCTFMTAIQFWASMNWKNAIIPIAIGMAGLISIIVLSKGWEYANYHPYGLTNYSLAEILFENGRPILNRINLYGLAGVLVFYLLGSFQMTRKRIMG